MTVFKLAAAVAAGILMGWTRNHKPAGSRTFALVTLGSAMFTLLSLHGFQAFSTVPIDVTRIVSNIITGIGFIGAGVIFRQTNDVSGVTTAAGIWTAAAVGIAIGTEEWLLAGLGVLFAHIVFMLKSWVTIEPFE